MTLGAKPEGLLKHPRRKELYNGHSNVLYESSDPSTVIIFFKDSDVNNHDTPAFSNGIINNRFSELMMSRLCSLGIDNHLIDRVSMHEQLVLKADPLPFRVRVHNFANLDFASRTHFEPWTSLPETLIEFVTKDAQQNYSVISEKHIQMFEWASESELEQINEMCKRVNDFAQGQFLAHGLRIVNFKIEFGRVYFGEFEEESRIIIIGSLGLERFELLDCKTMCPINESSNLLEGPFNFDYQEISSRFGVLEGPGPVDLLSGMV